MADEKDTPEQLVVISSAGSGYLNNSYNTTQQNDIPNQVVIQDKVIIQEPGHAEDDAIASTVFNSDIITLGLDGMDAISTITDNPKSKLEFSPQVTQGQSIYAVEVDDAGILFQELKVPVSSISHLNKLPQCDF